MTPKTLKVSITYFWKGTCSTAMTLSHHCFLNFIKSGVLLRNSDSLMDYKLWPITYDLTEKVYENVRSTLINSFYSQKKSSLNKRTRQRCSLWCATHRLYMLLTAFKRSSAITVADPKLKYIDKILFLIFWDQRNLWNRYSKTLLVASQFGLLEPISNGNLPFVYRQYQYIRGEN